MKTRQPIFKQNLKNFFFNTETKKNTIPMGIPTNIEEEKNLKDYLEAYQKVTRWK